MKAAEMAKVSARGGFNLLWGLAVSTVISAVGIIVVARLLSPSEYGLVMVALTAPGLVTMFRDWGVDSALIKYTAQYRSENKASEVKSLLAAGLFFELISGFFLSLILFFLAGFIATNIFNRPETTPLIQVASFTVFAGALLTASQSFFTGYEKMELTSITMVCQSVLKTVLAPLLGNLRTRSLRSNTGKHNSGLGRGIDRRSTVVRHGLQENSQPKRGWAEDCGNRENHAQVWATPLNIIYLRRFSFAVLQLSSP